ncbi:GSCFA domain-containing protein [Terrimonas pollutisoli]|uniref:GSCFA domain-containing protein n=1 Tax=Terrimonas pollutisoli TaxID=3034147 RepID=UPI0023EBF14E|nr:GSCFA domain-containing protein [Terrimonas sp. H1YJ31]
MDFMLNFEPKKLSRPINYQDKLLLIGSCFTEHIGNALGDAKFSLLQNPNGILFDPVSVCNSLISYIHNKKYTGADLFQLNEVWNSWQHHSRFSHIDKNEGLRIINDSQQRAHEFLKQADWVIITLGSAFYYLLTDQAQKTNEVSKSGVGAMVVPTICRDREGVANCHRAPAQWFNKYLLTIPEIIESLDLCMHQLLQFNSKLQIIFTISPVRHLRDGVVENNRSKARLIEAVHHMVNKFDKLHYFPAYELVIDVLRDYRFYDIDFAHPNYLATDFVLQKFSASCLDDEARQIMEELKKISIARKHRPVQPATNAHKQFLKSQADKTRELQSKYPFLDLKEELEYFSS